MKLNVENFNSQENKIAFMLLHAMTSEDAKAIADKMAADGVEEMDIHLICNGRELDIERLFTNLYDAIDSNVKASARELFDEIVSDKVNDIILSLESIQDTCRSVNEQIDWLDLFNKFYDEKKYNELASLKEPKTKE